MITNKSSLFTYPSIIKLFLLRNHMRCFHFPIQERPITFLQVLDHQKGLKSMDLIHFVSRFRLSHYRADNVSGSLIAQSVEPSPCEQGVLVRALVWLHIFLTLWHLVPHRRLCMQAWLFWEPCSENLQLSIY